MTHHESLPQIRREIRQRNDTLPDARAKGFDPCTYLVRDLKISSVLTHHLAYTAYTDDVIHSANTKRLLTRSVIG